VCSCLGGVLCVWACVWCLSTCEKVVCCVVGQVHDVEVVPEGKGLFARGESPFSHRCRKFLKMKISPTVVFSLSIAKAGGSQFPLIICFANTGLQGKVPVDRRCAPAKNGHPLNALAPQLSLIFCWLSRHHAFSPDMTRFLLIWAVHVRRAPVQPTPNELTASANANEANLSATFWFVLKVEGKASFISSVVLPL